MGAPKKGLTHLVTPPRRRRLETRQGDEWGVRGVRVKTDGTNDRSLSRSLTSGSTPTGPPVNYV